MVIGVLLSTVLGIAMAITLQKPFRGRAILIAIMVLPWALPGVVEGIVWSGIWDSNTGLLNSVLTSVHLIDHYQVFLGAAPVPDRSSLVELVQVWQMTPLSALLVLAACRTSRTTCTRRPPSTAARPGRRSGGSRCRWRGPASPSRWCRR